MASICLVFTLHVQQMLQSEAIDVSRCFIHEKYCVSKAVERANASASEKVGKQEETMQENETSRERERKKKSKQVNRET